MHARGVAMARNASETRRATLARSLARSSLGRSGLRSVAHAMLVLLMLLPSTLAPLAQAQSPAAVASLIGTWRVIAFEDRPSTGPSRFLFGTQPTGLLIYDATGHMSIQMMAGPRQKVTAADVERMTLEAAKATLFDGYAAYFGTYSVDAARSVVTHHVAGDLHGTYTGGEQTRPYEIDGNRLILRPRWTEGGQQWEGVRVFERVGRDALALDNHPVPTDDPD